MTQTFVARPHFRQEPASMDVFVDISGLDDLQRDLADLPRQIVEECFPDALAAGGAVIEDEIRRRTPKSVVETSTGKEYGPLVDALSTNVETDEQSLSGNAKVGFDNKGSGFVAVMVERGHRMVTHKGKQVGSVQAHPFIRPAGEAAEDGAVEAFTDSLLENIGR